jgi:hypothetical protein
MINTEHILAVLRRQRERAYETHDTEAEAKTARARLSNLLFGVKTRYAAQLASEGVTHDHLANVGVYVDDLDGRTLIVGPGAIARRHGPYAKVLRIAIGDHVFIPLGRTKPESVAARLRKMALEVEVVLGARPTWRAEIDVVRSSGSNVYRITRLPDDYDPATGAPRKDLTGARKKAEMALWERINRLLEDYETGTLYEALMAEQPPPPIPAELEALLAQHKPKMLADLRARVAECGTTREAA